MASRPKHAQPGLPEPVGAHAERIPLGRAELLLIFAFWTCMAVLTAVNQGLDPRARGPVSGSLPSVPIALAFIQCYLWALVTLVIFRLTNRFNLERSSWGWRLLLYVALGLLLAIGMDTLLGVLRREFFTQAGAGVGVGGSQMRRPSLQPLPAAGPFPAATPGGQGPGPSGLPAGPSGPGGPPPLGTWFGVTHLWFLDDLIVFIAILAAGFARDYFVRYRMRQGEAVRLQAEAAQLKAQLAEARLSSLRAQLDPHFLFNTLHAVSSLVERDPRGVRRMISRLSELLRGSLEGAQEQEVPLERELEFVGRYLEIMQIRFQGSLVVETAVDPAVRDALVPNLVLQPLVENAIKHGVSKVTGGGRIEIGAHRDDGRVILRVRDNGPGESGAIEEGVGLRNTRERLAALYGPAQSLTFRPAEGGGTEVEVVLPYHTQADLRTSAVNPGE